MSEHTAELLATTRAAMSVAYDRFHASGSSLHFGALIRAAVAFQDAIAAERAEWETDQRRYEEEAMRAEFEEETNLYWREQREMNR